MHWLQMTTTLATHPNFPSPNQALQTQAPVVSSSPTTPQQPTKINMPLP